MGVDDPVRTAAALVVGDEILNGKVQEQNLRALAGALRELGIRLARAVVVPDEVEVIAREVRELSRAHDLVMTSGGVGPTHDDVTIEGVGRALDVELVMDARLEALLRAHYGERCTAAHLRMARVPTGADLVIGDGSTWPAVVVGNVWLLPGVPELFRAKLGLLRERLGQGATFFRRAILTCMDEGDLAPLLDRAVAAHPRVRFGSYPRWRDPSCRTEITLDGTERAAVDDALSLLVSLLPEGEPKRVD